MTSLSQIHLTISRFLQHGLLDINPSLSVDLPIRLTHPLYQATAHFGAFSLSNLIPPGQ